MAAFHASLACLQVFQGIILAQRDRFAAASAASASKLGSPTAAAFGGAVTSPEGYLLGLWAHECQRVFADKLITLEDKAWVESTVAELAKLVRVVGAVGAAFVAARGTVFVLGGWEGALVDAENWPRHMILHPAACSLPVTP